MVTGLNSFKECLSAYTEQYTIIGGTACDLLMTENGIDFRATKDVDMVLIVEALAAEFGAAFWNYIKEAGYEHKNKSMPEFITVMAEITAQMTNSCFAVYIIIDRRIKIRLLLG